MGMGLPEITVKHPIFLTKSLILDNNSILYLVSSSIGYTFKRRISFSSLFDFFEQLKNSSGKIFDNCTIISPIKTYQIDILENFSKITIISEYQWVHPLIQCYWGQLSEHTLIEIKDKFDLFCSKYKSFSSEMSIKEFYCFESYFAKNGFDMIYNNYYKTQSLSKLKESTDNLYLSHIIYHKIGLSNSPSSKEIVQEFNSIKFNAMEYTYMFFLNCHVIDHGDEEIKFHHYPNLLNKLSFIEFAYNSNHNLQISTFLLSKAIDSELNNFYPSLNLAVYLLALSNFLSIDKTRKLERIFHTKLAFQKMKDYIFSIQSYSLFSINQLDISTIIAVLQNTKLEISSSESTISLAFEDIKTVLKKLFEILPDHHFSTMNLLDISFLIHSFNSKIPPISGTSNLEQLWRRISTPEFFNQIISSSEILDLTLLIQLINYFVNCIQLTTIDPNSLLDSNDFLVQLREKYEMTLNELDNEMRSKLFMRYYHIDIFSELVDISEILFSGSHPDHIITSIVSVIKKSPYGSKLLKTVNNRIYIFIAHHFFDLSISIIRSYLQFQSFDNNTNLNVDVLIHHLLLQLLGDRDLTPADYQYMREYLDLDDDMLNDNSSGGIAELIFHLNRLDETPTVVIDNDDGTLSEMTFSQQSDFEISNSHDRSDPNLPLPYLPAPIFDLFDDDDENLNNYLRLFFRYHRIRQDLARDNNADPERLYYELLEIDPEKQLVDDYFAKLTTLRKNHPQIVDDLVVELLTIELILREFPSFAIPRLTNLKVKMLERDVDLVTWKQFFKLSFSVYIKLDLSNDLANTQLHLDLLDIYSDLNPLQVGDLPLLVRYLELIDELTPELATIIEKHSSLNDFIAALIAYSTDSLGKLITTDLDPFVEYLVLIHLSWQSVTEIEKINEIYIESNILAILRELEQASITPLYQWSHGLLLHPVMLNTRLLELQQNDISQAFLTQLHEEFAIIPEKQRAVWDTLQTLLVKYDDLASQTDESNLLDLI